MVIYLNYVLNILKFAQAKNEGKEQSQEKRSTGRGYLLSFSPFPKTFSVEEDNLKSPSFTPPPKLLSSQPVPAQEYLSNPQCPPSLFERKFMCMLHAGKLGLLEGCLTGVFFGGGWGLYRYVNNYINAIAGDRDDASSSGNKDSYDGSKGSENESKGSDGGSRVFTDKPNETTINDNIIFVSACDSAIVLGVICALANCTKAAIFCN